MSWRAVKSLIPSLTDYFISSGKCRIVETAEGAGFSSLSSAADGEAEGFYSSITGSKGALGVSQSLPFLAIVL